VLSVLGVGASTGETVLTGHVLAGSRVAEGGSMKIPHNEGLSCRSTLPVSYLLETGNADPRAAKAAALASPTELAHRAALQALTQVGISAEQLGLVIGDCCTPYQVTPAEGQRLADKFGIKVPSYDIFTTTGPIPGHLDVLASWNELRVPEYALLFSTNTPTQRVNFGKGGEAISLGDGAGALVVSTQHKGKLALRDVGLFHDSRANGMMSFNAFEHASISAGTEALVYEIALEVGKKALSTNQLDASKVKFIGPEFTVSGGAKLARELGVSAQNHWSLLAEVGNALGASPVLNLAAHWQEIQKGDLVVCVQVGVGVSYGYAVFEGL
jgi:3-oxoacyl-[acyl-carrier-protein] synthase III